MTLSNNLTALRKRKGYSQEELAYQLGVSRQSVSKWELGQSAPELDRIIEIADLFQVSVDELVRDESVSYDTSKLNHQDLKKVIREAFHFEYKSALRIGNIPLVHVNFGRGKYIAKGIFAFGNIALGMFSVGGLAAGLVSVGGVAIGGVALAGLALGIFALGGASIGYVAIGGLAIGIYACGGVAIATKLAIGGMAHGYVAIGNSVQGSYTLVVNQIAVDGQTMMAFIQQHLSLPQWMIDFLTAFM